MSKRSITMLALVAHIAAVGAQTYRRGAAKNERSPSGRGAAPSNIRRCAGRPLAGSLPVTTSPAVVSKYPCTMRWLPAVERALALNERSEP